MKTRFLSLPPPRKCHLTDLSLTDSDWLVFNPVRLKDGRSVSQVIPRDTFGVYRVILFLSNETTDVSVHQYVTTSYLIFVVGLAAAGRRS